MKFLFLIIGSVMLASCSAEYDAEEESNSPVVGQVITPDTTFTENVLENDHFILEIEKVEVIQSPAESNPGLFVTYRLTNKSDSEELLPLDTLLWIELEQHNETSRVILDSMYHFLDAFGDDTGTYNEMVDKSNSRNNYLLPGKTIEVVEAYTLNNNEFPVTFRGLDYDTFEEVGRYIFNLDAEAIAIEKVPEVEVYEVAEEPAENTVVALDSSEAVNALIDNGFTVSETEQGITATPLSSGISQGIWLATQNNDADAYLSNVIHPLFADTSAHIGGKVVYLYSYEGDLILSAENGVITYSIVY